MNEKRRSPRYPVSGLEGTLLYNIDARILNLGLTGMALATSSALRVGHVYTLTLGAGIGSLRLAGFVAWCRLARTRKTESGDTAPVFEAGIRFEGMLSERAEQLLHLLEENAVISLETRVAGRFRLPDQDEPVQIESQVEFEVVKLSASGMLIECDVAVAAETRAGGRLQPAAGGGPRHLPGSFGAGRRRRRRPPPARSRVPRPRRRAPERHRRLHHRRATGGRGEPRGELTRSVGPGLAEGACQAIH